MSKRKITVGVVAIILLVVGSVWALRSRTDPQVEKVKQLQAEAFKPGTTPEQRRQNFDLVRQEMDKLSPDQRREVRDQMREGFQRRMDQQIKEYFALPPKDRTAYLDKQINEMEKRRKEWEARRAQAGQSGLQGAPGDNKPTPGPGDSRVAPGPADKAPTARRQRAACSGATRGSTTPPPSRRHAVDLHGRHADASHPARAPSLAVPRRSGAR